MFIGMLKHLTRGPKMKKDSEEKKPKEDPVKKMHDELIRAVAMSEMKLEERVRENLCPLEQRIKVVHDDVSNIEERADHFDQQFFDVENQLAGVEKKHSQLFRDFGAYQNKMFGVDELVSVCNRHDSELIRLKSDSEAGKEVAQRVSHLDLVSKSLEREAASLSKKLPLVEQSLSEKLKVLKGRMNELEVAKKEEEAQHQSAMKELKQQMADLMREFDIKYDAMKMSDANLGGEINRVEGRHDSALVGLAEKMDLMEKRFHSRLDDVVKPFDSKLDDCIDRIDFAEAQGNRMNRLEKMSSQHDQMIKEMYRQLKEMK